MNYKRDVTPEVLDEILYRKYLIIDKKVRNGTRYVIHFYQCGDGEFGLESSFVVGFHGSEEHLHVLAKHNIYIH